MRRLFLLSGLCFCVSAHAIIIDDFSTGRFYITRDGDVTDVQEAAVPGGIRGVDVHVIKDFQNGYDFLMPSEDPGQIRMRSDLPGYFDIFIAGQVSSPPQNGDLFDFSNFRGLGGAIFTSFYDLRFGYFGVDQDSMSAEVTIQDTNGNISSFTSSNLARGDGTVVARFRDFVGNADFNSVNGMSFRVNFPEPDDFNVSGIYMDPVPEPTTLAALALGVSLLMRRRRA